MKPRLTPTLDDRDAARVLNELLKRRPAYLNNWDPKKPGTGLALSQIFGRYMEALIQRLNQAPEKHFLALLDMLGFSLIPARAARAPVVFQPPPGAVLGRIEAGTRLGAQVAGRTAPVMFETEGAIAMAAARLVEVRTIWPGKDSYADHSIEVAGQRPFTLFKSVHPVPHECYLAHQTLFAFAGESTLQLEVELATGGSSPLAISWEYWDGQVWQPFSGFDSTDRNASADGTNGLMRSGVVTLRAECGESAKRKVHGIDGYWVRGRLRESLPPDQSRVLPLIDRIGLRTSIERKFDTPQSPNPGNPQPAPSLGLIPDQAFAEGTALDVSKEFYPFGRAPERDSAFYFENQEIFSKPGARVTVRFRRAVTADDEGEKEGERIKRDVNHARDVLIQAMRDAATGALGAAKDVKSLTKQQSPVSNTVKALNDAVAALNTAIQHFPNAGDYRFLGNLPEKARYLHDKVAKAVAAIEGIDQNTDFQRPKESDDVTKWKPFAKQKLKGCYEIAKRAAGRMEDVLSTEVVKNSQKIAAGLVSLGPYPATKAGGTKDAKLQPPRLIWEYWDGRQWQALLRPSADPEENFWFGDPTALGKKAPRVVSASFSVPEDIATTSVNGIDARWVRVRIESGSYKRLRLVSWYDAEAGKINFLSLAEPRPPALNLFVMTYVYRSSASTGSSPMTGGSVNATAGPSSISPEHCLTYNDFRFEQHSTDVRWPGRFFAPFRPVTDATPTLYLGFDKPLPHDLISLYLDVGESRTVPPAWVWEAWDGIGWQRLSVTDETNHFQRSGMVSFIAPKIKQRPRINILQAGGMQIVAEDALSTAVFQVGDQLTVAQDNMFEMATAQKIESAVIYLEAPLNQTYNGGTVEMAALPRFGVPRDWVRVRLGVDGKPPRNRFSSIHLNAAWAVQRQTMENEVLASGTGQRSQTLFLSQGPVLPGEYIEVRELEGARAAIELPLLKEELSQNGHPPDELRTVTDPVTGRIGEVWVRWRARPHFFFSRPEDRHYMIERARGRLIFGDSRNGRLPPIGANNIRARRYQTGGGAVGNVPAGAIKQLLGFAPSAQAVTNPHAADGGADGETLSAARIRGPEVLRHRGRALSVQDYETLAREASPGVATARALPATAPNGLPAPGWVTVIIVPQSRDARPQPSYELRRRVHGYLAARAPATVAPERIAVIGPVYLPVGIAATVAVREASEAGPVRKRLESVVTDFLHPLTGGPKGRGWPFDRNVYLSDLATVIEGVPGVDYAEQLELLLSDTPQGEEVQVPPERMVVAGTLRLQIVTAER
jgi:hypothetical protein